MRLMMFFPFFFLTIAGCSSPHGAATSPQGNDAGAGGDAGDASSQACAPPTSLTWTSVAVPFGTEDLLGIWGTSASDVYLGTDQGNIYHLGNGKWVRETSGVAFVGAGWGSGPSNVYAVGAVGWVGGQGAVLHSTGGGSWSAVAAVGSGFTSIWGSSAGDVYVAGPGGVKHSRSGGPFVAETVPGGRALSVWGSGANDVYVTLESADGTIAHSTGDGTWTVQYSETADEPWAIWGGGPAAVYAILSPDSYSYPTASVVYSAGDGGWNGGQVDTKFTKLVSLWASCPNDVYVGGWHEDGSGNNTGGALYHSTGGGEWTPVSLPGGIEQVRALWGSSAGDVYVGVADPTGAPVLLHGQS
jgi:hypothetical protein